MNASTLRLNSSLLNSSTLDNLLADLLPELSIFWNLSVSDRRSSLLGFSALSGRMVADFVLR